LPALVIGGLIFLGLRPLRQLAGALHRRSPHDLSPIDLSHLPREMRPLVDAMNTLLLEISRAFERERRFTGDAAPSPWAKRGWPRCACSIRSHSC